VWLQQVSGGLHQQVVLFHLGFNVALAVLFIGSPASRPGC
jgi:hypothetical protein